MKTRSEARCWAGGAYPADATAMDVLLGETDGVLLAEAALGLGAQQHGVALARTQCRPDMLPPRGVRRSAVLPCQR